MPNAKALELDGLFELRDQAGPVYGSEDLSLLLYALARRERPMRVMELGTGIGACTMWIAQALQENGEGHIWSIDDGECIHRSNKVRKAATAAAKALGLKQALLADGSSISSLHEFLDAAAATLKVTGAVTFLRQRIEFDRAQDSTPAICGISGPFDWVFSDFGHGPLQIVEVIAKTLPRLAPVASVFFDSVPTRYDSFLTLERIATMLDEGRIPQELEAHLDAEEMAALERMLPRRRFRLVHLVERKDRPQNSTAWLQVHPAGLQAWPHAPMRRPEL
jgi:hypothetical protein